MANFDLTIEMMDKAITYMPLAQKTVLAELIARKCLKRVKPLDEQEDEEKFLIVPSVVGEDNYQKECMLLNALLSHYFDIKIPTMDNKLYDKYMKVHFINQLERYKQNPTYQKKAFDILTDFKTLRRMVDTELYNLKTKENDLLERLMKGLALFSAEKMTNNPEYLKNITSELQKFAETATAQQVNLEETITDNV